MPETQCTDSLPGILAEIVEKKRGEVSALSPQANRLEAAVSNSPVVRDFLSGIISSKHVSLIAECKRRSPGAGLIRPNLELDTVSRSYEEGGAAALSVLTDAPYFGGSLEDLRVVREQPAYLSCGRISHLILCKFWRLESLEQMLFYS